MVDRAATAGIDLLTVVGGELVDALLDAITEWPEAIRGHDAAAAIADGAARRGNPALAARANAWPANHPLFTGQVHVTGSGLTPGELVLVDVDGRNIGFVNADRHGQVNGSVQLPSQPFPHREATAVGQTSGIAAHAILS
jgi:hypothetical protein